MSVTVFVPTRSLTSDLHEAFWGTQSPRNSGGTFFAARVTDTANEANRPIAIIIVLVIALVCPRWGTTSCLGGSQLRQDRSPARTRTCAAFPSSLAWFLASKRVAPHGTRAEHSATCLPPTLTLPREGGGMDGGDAADRTRAELPTSLLASSGPAAPVTLRRSARQP
jgi:hypothetical protein